MILENSLATKGTIADYRQNIAAAYFPPVSPEFLQLRLALLGNQEDTNRFVMALEGWIPPEQLFSNENLKRIRLGADSHAYGPSGCSIQRLIQGRVGATLGKPTHIVSP